MSDFSEQLVLVSGGALISSTILIIHLASTLNPHHKPLVPLVSTFLAGVIAWYAAILELGLGPLLSLRHSMGSALEGFFSLMPLIFAIFTLHLIRITLLTNRPVAASS